MVRINNHHDVTSFLNSPLVSGDSNSPVVEGLEMILDADAQVPWTHTSFSYIQLDLSYVFANEIDALMKPVPATITTETATPRIDMIGAMMSGNIWNMERMAGTTSTEIIKRGANMTGRIRMKLLVCCM